MSSATEPVNPPHPGKLELIERVARGIEGPWRFADLGGLWAVHGVYAFHALAQPGCVGGTEVDTHPTRNFLSALADEPLLAYVQGNFGDREVFAKLPHFDVVFLFDTLLHQVSPDWGEILRMYASRASHVVIFNQQYTGEQSIRLLDLGEDAYFSNVPHDRNHPTYADLFRKLDEKHPAHDRNWRDVHHIWQWGITNNDLIARMAELGFEQTFHRDWGQVLDLARFENHAFIFSRIASRPISTAGADDAVTVGPTEAETEGHEDTALPDQLPALAAIEDDGTLVARPVGEQLRLMRAFRRSLRPGGELRIAAVGAQAHVLIERARYAGFTTATPHADTLVLHTADRRMVEGELPLVTIAIPAFKPGHFAACLESALAQTYPRLQILVSDDSGNDLLRQIASRLATADRIEWIRNPATLGGRANFIQCIERARGDFIKFLCDDDVLEPDCVERMVEAFRSDPQATLVFSRRQRIDGDGKALSDDHHTEALAEQDCVFRGEALAGAVIALQSNFIGEPSTVMFRRADIAWIRPHYAAFDGHDDIRVVGDIAAWHNLLSQGDAVYIARPLSRFRIHAGQSQARAEVRELIASSWQKLAHGSHSLGFAHDPHPLVPHRKPGTTEWHIDPTLPLNRRLAARAHHTAATPAEPLAATVLRLVETALAPTAECAPAPLRSDDYPRYEAAAELLAAGHRVDGAEALIALATEGTPVWEVYADLAEIALAQGERDAALELMQAATERAPDSARAVLGTATLQAEGGNFEGALSTLSPFLRKHPHDTGALTLVRGILGAASELSAVAWARLLADLRYEAATLRAELSSRDFALETLRAAAASALSAAQDMLTTEVTPAPGVASTGAAASELPTQALSNEPEALPDLQAPALAEDRRQLEVARALIASDKLAEATDILSALVLAGTPLADAYHDLGCIAVRQSDAETAISLFGMALERDPKSVSARRNLALTQGIEQRFEDALATLSPILRSGSVSNDDYGLVRDILGKAPTLGPVAWARLLADLRSPSDEQRHRLDDYDRMRDELAALRAANAPSKASPPPRPSKTSTAAGPGTNPPDLLTALGYLSAHELTGFKWFSEPESYLAWDKEIKDKQELIERHIAAQQRFPGYCGLCQHATTFTVSAGIQLEGHTHLREGMLCEHCHTHNRARVLGLSIERAVSHIGSGARVLLMEATTPLYDHLSSRLPNLIGSEFQSTDIRGGAPVSIGGRTVRHENILRLSFADQSLDVVAHADLLEHVPDVETALAECFRVLRTGGQLVFSAPFSQTMSVSRKRATLDASGEITHLFPAEYHGTHLAYYNFGWDLLDICRSAGFSSVRLGVCFDPLQGLLSTGRFGGYFMQPIVISCTR